MNASEGPLGVISLLTNGLEIGERGREMLEWCAANWKDVIAILGTLAGVIGVYFGSKGWKRKKPTYVTCSNTIFSGLEHTVPDVEVKFSGYGQPITALTVTKLSFWNAGTETLNKQDVVKDDPITIRGKQGIVLLSAIVVEPVSQLNKINCQVNQERSLATITFDYLDHNQGAIFQVFHTGTSNGDISVGGTIKGASPITRKLRGNSTSAPLPIWAALLPVCILWLVWGLSAGGIIYSAPEPFVPVREEPISVEAAGVGLLGLTIVFGIVLYVYYIPKPFSKIFRQ